jgi:AMP-binding enzyme
VERAVSTGTRIEADPLMLSVGSAHHAAGTSDRATSTSDRGITERILGRADQAGYKAALIDAPEGIVTAWPRFAWTVRAAADGLSRRGLADGDTAGVFVQDAASFAIAVNAIRAAGAMAWPIRPEASMADVAAQLNACGARVLVTAAPLAETAAEAADRSRVRQVFAFGEAPGTTPFRSLLGIAKHSADNHGAGHYGAGEPGTPGEPGREPGAAQPDQYDAMALQPGFALSHRDVVVAGPPCGEGQAYTALLDLTLLTGATIVAAPVTLITAAMRVYKGTAAIVSRDTQVPGLPPDRVFAVT